MQCPHCKKKILNGNNKQVVDRATELMARGHTLPNISKKLSEEGFHMTVFNLGRLRQRMKKDEQAQKKKTL